jgi:hypothetical protein
VEEISIKKKKKDHSDFILPVPYCFKGSTGMHGTVPIPFGTALKEV